MKKAALSQMPMRGAASAFAAMPMRASVSMNNWYGLSCSSQQLTGPSTSMKSFSVLSSKAGAMYSMAPLAGRMAPTMRSLACHLVPVK